MPKNNTPIAKFKDWPIDAAVWPQDSENGTFYNVTIQRSYKDGDEYKSSGSFGADDLLKIQRLCGICYAWIRAEEEKNRAREERK